MNMRERMARALFAKAAKRALPLEINVRWEDQEEFRQQQYLSDVDAMLGEMERPSGFTLREGIKKAHSEVIVLDVFQAMIKAIREGK